MQQLRQVSQLALQGCFSAQWGVGTGTGHPTQSLWTLCGDGTLQGYNLDATVPTVAQVQMSLPVRESVIVATPCIWVAPDEAPFMALGTKAGSVVLLELLPDQAQCTYTSEGWSVTAEVPHAHAAPVDAAAWSADSRFLATAAADGSVIIWRRQNLVRQAAFHASAANVGDEESSTFGSHAVAAICWDAQADCLLLACGGHLNVAWMQWNCERLQESQTDSSVNSYDAEIRTWSAHPGGVTSADWVPASRLIASTGCDCRCCLWDSNGVLLRCIPTEHLLISSRGWRFGRNAQMLASASGELLSQGHPTAVAWSPGGDHFVLALSGLLVLCNSRGYVLDIAPLTSSEYVFELKWSPDRRKVTAACGFSGLYTFEVISTQKESWRFTAFLEDQRSLQVEDNQERTQQRLSARDPVVDFAQSPECLAVITTRQCIILPTQELSSRSGAPCTVEAPQRPQQVFVGCGVVCYVDTTSLHVLSVSGNSLCSIPLPEDAGYSIRVSCSSDTLVIMTGRWRNRLQFNDTRSGKFLVDYVHSCEIKQAEISQDTRGDRCLVAIRDAKGTLLIADAARPGEWQEISRSLVISARWVWGTAVLVGIADGKLMQWVIPEATGSGSTIQRSQVLLASTTLTKCEILAAEPEGVLILHPDGTTRRYLLVSFFFELLKQLKKGNWNTSGTLCAIARHDSLWSCLARESLHSQ